MRELAGLFLLFLVAELVALLIVCVQAWRNPHGKEPATRVPDYVPDDWFGGGSPHETWPGAEHTYCPVHDFASGFCIGDCPDRRPGVVPYDRDDEYPGWGIPDGDTQSAADTPSGDSGVGGESS